MILTEFLPPPKPDCMVFIKEQQAMLAFSYPFPFVDPDQANQ
jgi:hypothetical protein